MEKRIIAAMSPNRAIGNNGHLPWQEGELKGDLKRFKQLTIPHPIIMGRKTAESMPLLPGRHSVVVSRSGFERGGYTTLPSLESAYDWLEDPRNHLPDINYSLAYIIGGGEIFAQAIDHVNQLEITQARKMYEGDTFFPEFSFNNWEMLPVSDEDRKETHSYITYVRKT